MKSNSLIAVAFAVLLTSCGPAPENSTSPASPSPGAKPNSEPPRVGFIGDKGLLKGTATGIASCSRRVEVAFEWNIGRTVATESVQLWVGEGTAAKLFAAGGATGSAVTGPWTAPATVFVLRNGTDNAEIDRLVIPGDPCPPKSRKTS